MPPSPHRAALVTGSAGFIGRAVAERLLAMGWQVTGIDAMTDYYDVSLKRARHASLEGPRFRAVEARIETPGALDALMAETRPELVIHLAAQAGVRYSLKAPETYLDANLTGTFRLLEAARAHPPRHLMMASTSSVYGAETEMPYRETMRVGQPLSFYAATKTANEAMAHAYAHLHGLPITLFRFFTVYGPWGRPDMAPWLFVSAAFEGRPIDVYNHGRMRRDFTYVDDLAEAVARLADVPPAPPEGRVPEGDSLSPVAPHRIVNIGNAEPVELMAFIAAIERATGRRIETRMLPIQPGDVPATWADIALLQRLTGYRPATPVEDGIARFVDWYRAYAGAWGNRAPGGRSRSAWNRL